MNKNIKKIFFVLLLMTLLLTVSAVNATNDDSNTTSTVSEKTSEDTYSSDIIAKEEIVQSPEKQINTNKEINKKNKTKENTKKDPTTIEVYDTITLTNALNTIQSDTTTDEFIINFNEGNYDFGSNNFMLMAAKTYILNGNNQTLKAQMFGSAANNVKSITVRNLNVETRMAFALASLSGTGEIINSTITSPQLIFNHPILIIDDDTELNNVTRVTVMNTNIYTNNSKIINKFLELGVPEDRITSSSSNNDNILIENVNITEPKSFNGNNVTILKSNITAEINTIGNIIFTNCLINAKITNQGNLTLQNCSLSNNNLTTTSSKTDGFLLKNNGNLEMINCIVENNTFNTTATGNVNIYGAIVNNGSMSVENCVFNNNKIGHYIKELTSYTNDRMCGNAPTITNTGKLKINNSKFSNNFAGYRGGAIQSLNNKLYINNSQFTNNHAILLGGAISIGEPLKTATFNIENSLFTNNSASNDMTGGYADTVYMTAEGGAIYVFSANGTINNSTFKNNKNSTIRCGYETSTNDYYIINITNNKFEENKATILTNYYNTYFNIINNTFINNTNTTSIIYNSAADAGHTWTEYKYQEQITNNTFKNNNLTNDTIRQSSKTWGTDTIKTYNKTIIKNNNTYQNTTINDKIELKIPQKIYTEEPTTITGTYTINNPENYDSDILNQNKFNIYINGVLNQTIDELEFTVTPTAGTMMITVQPTISQTRKTTNIKATTLTNITITPENYNEYIYEEVLIGVSKDTKVKFSGEFTDKDEILFDTSDIIIDGSDATFTNTVFILDAKNIILQNMIITDTETQYPIKNHQNNNIITNNTITLTNTDTYGAAIYNGASNTIIANNTLTVKAPAGDIDFSTGQGVASTQAILLLSGDNNTVQNNNINVEATSTSFYGTLEAITNSNEATNTLITQNKINITGANFNYAIDSLNTVTNINITENTITVTGERYCDGIQVGNGANNILIDNNNITCICINTTELDTEGAITYGVIATSMGSEESSNITIANNNINITGTANYGIELYKVDTTEIHNNTITVNGPYSMGIGYAYSPNGNATGNTITINGDSTTPINMITEEFKPENTGIRIQNGTNNVSITDNTITTTDVGGQDTTIHTEPDNVTITNNKLISSQGYGSESIIAPTNAKIENNTIETTTTIEVPETTLTNTPVTLTATVTDEFENPINTGSITFTIGDEIIATAQVTDGTTTTTVTFTQEQDSTITATYTPTSTGLTTSTAEASISIQKPQTQLNIEDITLTAGETVTLTATITDQLQNNINGGKVTFKVNDKIVKDANGKVVYAKVVDGIATAEYTVPESLSGKEINITTTYSGTSTYNKETTTITTTIETPTPTLTITPITEDIQPGSTITLKAKVAVGDKAITSGKIVFKINGKTVKDENGKVIYAKVNSNGEVSINYTLPASYKVGSYTIEAVFTGVGYDKLTGNSTMTVVK